MDLRLAKEIALVSSGYVCPSTSSNLEFMGPINHVREVKVLNVVSGNEVRINFADKMRPFLVNGMKRGLRG